MCQGGDSGIRVRIKAGGLKRVHAGTVEHRCLGDRTVFVKFDDGDKFWFQQDDVEPEPEEPARDLAAILAGVGRWQQQDPMKRRVHFTAEPVESPFEALADAIEDSANDEAMSGRHQGIANARGMRKAAELVRLYAPQPTTHTSLQGHVVTVHVAFPGDPLSRSIRFTTPLSAAEVVKALDHLVSQPAGTRARATTTDAEALAIHADRTPAYYGPAEGIS